MSQIDALTNVDILQWLLWAFIIMYGFVAIVTVIGKTSEIIGKPVKWIRKKNEDHELLATTVKNLQALQEKHKEDTNESIQHDKMIREDLSKMVEIVEELKDEIISMRKQSDHDKLAEYKDKIGQSYRYYHERKYSDKDPVPYWNHMEKEALEGLIAQYEDHGGSNSFVHSVVEPEMETWKVVD